MSLVINRKHGERVYIFDEEGDFAGVIRVEGQTTQLHMDWPLTYKIVRAELLNERQIVALKRAGEWESGTMKSGPRS